MMSSSSERGRGGGAAVGVGTRTSGAATGGAAGVGSARGVGAVTEAGGSVSAAVDCGAGAGAAAGAGVACWGGGSVATCGAREAVRPADSMPAHALSATKAATIAKRPNIRGSLKAPLLTRAESCARLVSGA